MTDPFSRRRILAAALSAGVIAAAPAFAYELNGAHVHVTNFVQQGTDIHALLKIMGDKVGRATLFGIPLQQTWSYGNTGDFAPTYYLQTDAPLLAKLTPEASEKLRKGNDARLFDEARRKVRAWEKANLK